MLALNEGALVQQGDAVPLIREFVELLKKGVPGSDVGNGMDGVNREDFPIMLPYGRGSVHSRFHRTARVSTRTFEFFSSSQETTRPPY